MVDESFKGVPELAAALERLRAEHAKSMAMTATLARAIDDLQRIQAYLDDAQPPHSAATMPPMAPRVLPSTTAVPPIGPGGLTTRMGETGWARRLRGLTQYQALIRIAQDNDGVVRTTDARDIFIRAGLAHGKSRNVNGHIHHILARSDEFERVAPGTFRLVTPESPHHDMSPLAETEAQSDDETVDFA